MQRSFTHVSYYMKVIIINLTFFNDFGFHMSFSTFFFSGVTPSARIAVPNGKKINRPRLEEGRVVPVEATRGTCSTDSWPIQWDSA